MASISQTVDKQGNTVFKIRVSNGRGRQLTRSWRPEPTWSEKTTQWRLNCFAAQLERDFAAGEISTAKELKAQERQEALRKAQLRAFRQFAEEVFLPAKAAVAAENTVTLYKRLLTLYAFPAWADFPLVEITPAMCSKLLLDVAAEKSHSTVVTFQAALKGLFDYAVEVGALETSPMAKAKVPQRKKDTEKAKKKDLTQEELERIFSALSDEPLEWRAVVTLMADTGCRRGELCGLQWADVDFKKGTVHIHRNLVQAAGGVVHEGATKTGESRFVDIGPETLSLLHQWREAQSHSCISAWCFTKEGTADPITPQTVGNYFIRLSKKCNVPGLHPHMLRHTAASLALRAGADVKSVSQRLGHANATTTLKTYSHASEESIRHAGDLSRAAMRKA